MTSLSDTQLVSLFKDNPAQREAAFVEILRRYRAPMEKLAARCLNGNYADTEDAMSKALLSAYRGLLKFRGESSLKWWLFRIAHNNAFNVIKGNRRRALSIDLDDCPPVIDWDQPSIQCQVQLGEYEDACNQVLSQATNSRRAAMELIMEGHSIRGAAALLSKSRSTVRIQVDHVRTKLKAKVPVAAYL